MRRGDTTRTSVVALVIAVVAVTSAACGSGDDAAPGSGGHMGSTMPRMSATPSAAASITPGPPASGPHNQADVDFATGMIPHHGQAIQMADMVLAMTGNPEVEALAERIKAAQAPEIATMSGWLQGWQVAVPDPFTNPAGGMHGEHMMSAGDMAELAGAAGPTVDRMFLTMMPEHHEGAIEMARLELSAGANPAAKALAQKIIGDQTAEIAEMKSMLDNLG